MYTVINLQDPFLAQVSNCQFFEEDVSLQNQLYGDTPRELKLFMLPSSLWQEDRGNAVLVPKRRTRAEHSKTHQLITWGLLVFIAPNVSVRSDYVGWEQATEQFDAAVSPLLFMSNRIWMPAILTVVCRDFPQTPQTNARHYYYLLPNSYTVRLHAHLHMSLTPYSLCS